MRMTSTCRARFKRFRLPPKKYNYHHLFLSPLYTRTRTRTRFNHQSLMSSSTSTNTDPFAWLGLLQWSLKYSDGTSTNADAAVVTPMSAEDRAFLETVMREGILNENDRMKTILYEVTQQIEAWKGRDGIAVTVTDGSCTSAARNVDADDSVDADAMYDSLQELRDIVEQIDFARAFVSMKGIPFLLGCIENKENIYIPLKLRTMCCAIIATLCQHNPPVQKECIELGAIKILYRVLALFISIQNDSESAAAAAADPADPADTDDVKARALFCERIVQAVSAIVRSYDLAETVFCQLEQAKDIFQLGLFGSNTGADAATQDDGTLQTSLQPLPPLNVRKRTLFFLHALITSDTTSLERIHKFQTFIVYAIDHILLKVPSQQSDAESYVDEEMVEMALGMIQQILEQRISVNAILLHKDPLAAAAVQRISHLRLQPNDDVEIELEAWERVLSLLADARPDPPVPPMNE
jgi:hsp70-interacting protein